MKTMKLALTALFLSTPAFANAYTPQDCSDYVKEKKYPAAYCQVSKDGEEELPLEQWLESLRKVPGPIQALEKKILADFACEPGDSCGIGAVQARARIVLDQGNDSNGGGSRIRYFLHYSQDKSEEAVYSIDVSQAVELEFGTAIRKIGKVQKFRD